MFPIIKYSNFSILSTPILAVAISRRLFLLHWQAGREALLFLGFLLFPLVAVHCQNGTLANPNKAGSLQVSILVIGGQATHYYVRLELIKILDTAAGDSALLGTFPKLFASADSVITIDSLVTGLYEVEAYAATDRDLVRLVGRVARVPEVRIGADSTSFVNTRIYPSNLELDNYDPTIRLDDLPQDWTGRIEPRNMGRK